MNVTKERLSSNDFNASHLNLTWKVSAFYDDTIVFKVLFEHPVQISPLIVQDKLVIHFNGSYDILTNRPDSRLVLIPNSRVLTKSLRKQMAETSFNEGFVDISESMSQSMNLLLAVVLMSVGDGQAFLLYVRAMTIVLHFPIF